MQMGYLILNIQPEDAQVVRTIQLQLQRTKEELNDLKLDYNVLLLITRVQAIQLRALRAKREELRAEHKALRTRNWRRA
jgi:hypothetical protein